MAIQLRNKNFLTTTSTASPGLFPPAAAFGISFWVFAPNVVSATKTIAHYTSTSDLSEFRIDINTSSQISVTLVDSVGTSVSGVISTALTGNAWNLVKISRLAGFPIKQSLNSNAAVNDFSPAFSATHIFATLTNLSIGRNSAGGNPADTDLLWYAVFNNNFSTSEMSALWNGGVATDPAPLASGETAVFPLRSDLASSFGGTAVSFACGREPVFVDDSSIHAVGSPWAPSAYQTMPAVRNGHVLSANGADNYLLTGASISRLATSRVSLHLANEIARAAGTRIRKLLSPAWNVSHASGNPVTVTVLSAGHASASVNSANNYIWNIDTGAPVHTDVAMALPLGEDSLDLYFPDAPNVPTGQYFLSVDVGNTGQYTGPLADLVRTGESVGIRAILRNGVDHHTFDGGTGGTAATYTGNPLLPNAQTERICSQDVSGNRVMQFAPIGGNGTWPAEMEDTYFQFVGVVSRNTNVSKGVGFGVISDQSWEMSGHNANATSGATIKQYSDLEKQGVVAPFSDPSHKLILGLFINNEAGMTTSVNAWITRNEAVCAALGITNYGFLLISPYCQMQSGGAGGIIEDRNTSRQTALDFDAIAAGNPKVCHISQYKLTDGCFFHNGTDGAPDPNDANGPQLQFLVDYDTAHGTSYATTPGRVMLSDQTHLADSPSAKFMCEVVAAQVVANGSSEIALLDNVTLTNPFSWSPFN